MSQKGRNSASRHQGHQFPRVVQFSIDTVSAEKENKNQPDSLRHKIRYRHVLFCNDSHTMRSHSYLVTHSHGSLGGRRDPEQGTEWNRRQDTSQGRRAPFKKHKKSMMCFLLSFPRPELCSMAMTKASVLLAPIL